MAFPAIDVSGTLLFLGGVGGGCSRVCGRYVLAVTSFRLDAESRRRAQVNCLDVETQHRDVSDANLSAEQPDVQNGRSTRWTGILYYSLAGNVKDEDMGNNCRERNV